MASLHKPERSISPESNDSISEELNHFKPIVCSPCTPPKRLPDGQVLSPLIIKSTPRNLNRSLQKQTSYEASPRILKKWEQIFQERHIKKTLSKATLTSLGPEAGEELSSSEAIYSSKDRPSLALSSRLSRVQVLSECAGPTSTDLECVPSVNQTKVEQDCIRKQSHEVPLDTCHSSEPRGAASGPSLEGEQFEQSRSAVDATLVKTCISTVMKTAAVNSSVPKNDVLGGVLKTKKQLKTLSHFDMGNGILVNSLGEEPVPSLRRGRKRRCKTKHLEQNGVKKLRPPSSDMGLAPKDPGLLEMGRKLQQEEEDQQLALQSQGMLDSERRTMSRRKGNVDQYLLRSSTLAGAK